MVGKAANPEGMENLVILPELLAITLVTLVLYLKIHLFRLQHQYRLEANRKGKVERKVLVALEVEFSSHRSMSWAVKK